MRIYAGLQLDSFDNIVVELSDNATIKAKTQGELGGEIHRYKKIEEMVTSEYMDDALDVVKDFVKNKSKKIKEIIDYYDLNNQYKKILVNIMRMDYYVYCDYPDSQIIGVSTLEYQVYGVNGNKKSKISYVKDKIAKRGESEFEIEKEDDLYWIGEYNEDLEQFLDTSF